MASKISKNRTIVLPLMEKDYALFMSDNSFAHRVIQNYSGEFPALFPSEITAGYQLNGRTRVSKKLGLGMRKIKVSGSSYRIRPSFILPYFRAKTDDVSMGLFLIRFGVPFWALAFVFGRYGMWWYRLYRFLGSYSLVGTTVHQAENLPKNLLADEHHIRIQGKKAYVATTVGGGCFLGMAATPKADEAALGVGYAVFKAEAWDLDDDYQPDSVNTDGWAATQNVWEKVVPNDPDHRMFSPTHFSK